MDLHTILTEEAQAEGFPLASTLDLDSVLDPTPHGPPLFEKSIQHFDRWISAGHAGAMSYLARGRDRRSDPRILFPGAQSMLCVALPYTKSPAGSLDEEKGPRYARYLQGPDYHLSISDKLERVMKRVSEKLAAQSNGNDELKWKVCVDTSAILEKSWAALAGLGWIGKNTLLLHPRYGSYLFLGEVLINQRTGRGPSPLPNYCGHCTRCLNACPTDAFSEPGVLNSNRCISYWTLEKKGAIELDPSTRKKFGPWVAGCDVCQEVCPFNLKALRLMPESATELAKATDGAATHLKTWEALLKETETEYKLRVRLSAASRMKYRQFSRNLAIALRNALETSATPFWERIKPLVMHRFLKAVEELDDVSQTEWNLVLKLIEKIESHTA
jgi:epoxyqueuosine reductase